MSSEQFGHIEKIRNDFHQANERIKGSLNNMIKELSDGLYSRNPHFIFELIQNAEDNTYNNALPSLSFRLTKIDPTDTEGSEGALIIKNNENGFTPDDVDVICRAGYSRKEKKQGYIGEKGIGFKSVFLVTDNPYIFSNGYQFRLPARDEETGFQYIVPQWTGLPEGLDCTQTHIILPLTKANFGYDQIEKMLLQIDPETILFLSKLQEIRIQTDNGTDFLILKKVASLPQVELLVEGKKQHRFSSSINKFLVCTETVNRPANIHQEKRGGIENREISIAFPLNEDSSSTGKIFAYLPVRSDTGFPFLINADFMLPSSREDIQDVPWNHWLMDCVANLVATKLLPALKERDLLTADFLEILATRLNDFEEGESGASYAADRDSLFRPIFAKIRKALMNMELLPANDGTFVAASNAKLARGDAIRNLLSDKQLGDLFDLSRGLKWLISEITLDRTPNLWQYLRYKLEIEEVDPEMFARRLTEQFLEYQCDAWFIHFYRFLLGQRSLWSDSLSILRFRPILRLQDDSQVNPPSDEDETNAYIAYDLDIHDSRPIIKAELTHDEESREFLEKLGVPEWDIVEEVLEDVLPKYGCNPPTVSIEDHKTDFKKIERAFGTASGEKRIRLERKLHKTEFILAKNAVEAGTTYRKPDDLYFESDDLCLYFEGDDSRSVVDLEKYPPSASGLFKELQVKDCIRVKKRELDNDGHVVFAKYPPWHKRGLNGFDPTIHVDGLEHAMNNPDPKKSAFIWNRIAKPHADCIKGDIEKATWKNYGNSGGPEPVTSAFGELLINSVWLPKKSDEEMYRPCELTIDDLPPSFKPDANLAEQLGMKRNEESELAEKVGIPVELIEVLKGARPEVLNRPGMLEKFKELLGGEDSVEGDTTTLESSDSEFPESLVRDPERRAAKFGEELKDSPKIEFEERVRSVRVNPPIEVARVRLKSEYTNDDGQMKCQICQKTMPFKKPDGEYYFEAVEAITKEHYNTEHEAKFLALCPVCAARYQVFIKQDEDAMQAMIDGLMASADFQVHLQLGELTAKLRFVETHWRDIKQILESV